MSAPAIPEESSDLAAQAPDLRAALTSFIDHHLRELNDVLADVEKRASGTAPLGEDATYEQRREDYRLLAQSIRGSVRALTDAMREPRLDLAERPVEQLSWRALSEALAQDEATAQRIWERVKAAARDELVSGVRAARPVEAMQPDPLDRARFFAVRAALADGLQPRNGMEWLLVDGMAQAWSMAQHWLRKHALTDELDAQGLRRNVKTYGQWEPPRLGDAEAVDRAALMADRFQRQFLRLMKCYRDGRRLAVSMTVQGGQVNVAEQQIVANSVPRSQ